MKSAIEITRILCTLFQIGVERNYRRRFSLDIMLSRERNSLADTHQIHKDYFLLFYTTTEFLEKSFVRCILLFNKTWKEMRACEVDFQVVRSSLLAMAYRDELAF